MSYYSQGDTKNELLEPHVHNGALNGGRTEFKLDGDLLPNMKLLNFGMVGDNTTRYNDMPGALGIIKNIFLYDGKNELTSIRRFNEVMAFKNLLEVNSVNSEIERLTKRHNIGYQNITKGDTDTNYERSTEIKNANSDNLAATDLTTNINRGYFDLSEAFMMLQKVPILSESFFPELRLVIEYDSNINNILIKNDGASTFCRPLLAVDRVMNPQVAQGLKDEISVLEWMEEEHDQVSVAALGDSVTSDQSFKLNGFNGKFIDRLRIKKKFQPAKDFDGANVRGFGQYASHNGNEEEFNLIVNGRSILPRGGIKGEAKRLALLTDTHGPLNITEDQVYELIDDYPSGDAFKRNHVDFFGIAIMDRVLDLKVEYKRTSLTDTNDPAPTKEALNLLVSCEVRKVMNVSSGGYNIAYV